MIGRARPSILLKAVAIAAALSAPALAQSETGGTTPHFEKFLAERTPISGLDQTTPSASVLGFAEAMIRSDYFTAYFYLSPAAKRGFVEAALSGDVGHLFIGDGEAGPSGPLSSGAGDLALDVQLDGARMFDELMFAAERDGPPVPFGFYGPDLETYREVATGEGQASVELVTGLEPTLLMVHLIRMSDGAWRIDLIGPEEATPDARRPWNASR